MATVAQRPGVGAKGSLFFPMAAAMAFVLVAGFSMQLGMGRSSFGAPLFVHAHALLYFGWVAIFLTQSWLGTNGPVALHRRLGWLSMAWVAAMVVAGFVVITWRVRDGQAPFFFKPQHFLIANPMIVLLFAALTIAAVANRRRRDWHARLHLCGMAVLTAPGFGRLLPMPLLMPYAYQIAALVALVFPVWGMIADRRRLGRVHPAWWWGVGATLAVLLLTELIVYSPVGDAAYRLVTDGAPGSALGGLAFAPPPGP